MTAEPVRVGSKPQSLRDLEARNEAYGRRYDPDVHVRDEPIRSDAHAARALSDTEYLVFILVQAMKLFITLAGKRWPMVKKDMLK